MHITFVHSHYESLGIEYLSAVLRRAGHQTDLVFEPALFHNFFSDNAPLSRLLNFKNHVVREVIRRKPDIVAFSVIADNYQWTLDMATQIKAGTGATIVFGGVYPTAMPETVLKDGAADYVVMGEGEEAFADLLTCLATDGDRAAIPNVGVRMADGLVINPLRPPLCNLDVLPFPDKDLFYREYPRMVSASYMIMGSRGCNNHCSYCWNSNIHRLYGGKAFFRRRSPENVIAELEWAKKKYRVRKVTFYDEVFTSDKAWLREFCERYRQQIGMSYFCCVHPSDVDGEIVSWLEKSGCAAVNVGMQTAHESSRRLVLHRRGTNQETSEALALFRKTKIFVYLNVMLGLPGETEDHLRETFHFCLENKVDIAAIYWLRYYPGTEIVKEAQRRGSLAADVVSTINAGRMYAPYAIAGNTYRQETAKWGNWILLSWMISPRVWKFIVKYRLERLMPSANLLFPSIVLACWTKVLFKGKKYPFHYFDVRDYFLYYLFYLCKKVQVSWGRQTDE